MLTVEVALDRVLAGVVPGAVESVPLSEALGRILAARLQASMDLPRWPNSAMDGYALRAANTPGLLRVVGEVAAGSTVKLYVHPGECVRIFTGAPVPEGADCVVMQENSVRQGDRVKFSVRAEVGQHIRPRGQDVRSGDTLLEPGVSITPGVLGLLATFGQADVRVYQRPRVALLSTGDEVVLPGQPLGDAQIYSSNNAALAGMITQAGGVVIDFGNVPDDPATLANRFAEAASVADVVVSTGGVSVGDHDHVKDVLGDKIEFWRVAMKPGKPLAFGKIDGKPFFGLPGNPVSCMVNFLQFVRPALRTMLGDRHPFLPIVRAQMSRTLKRSTGRVELLRVQLSRENGTLIATPAGGHQGSGNVRSMAESHGLVMVAAEAETVWGEVSVQVFDFGFEARETPGYPWGAAEEK